MYVVLFDGVCNLCNGTVNFIMDRDSKGQFKFSSLQSPYGQQIIKQFNLTGDYLNTVVLVEEQEVYLRSKAVLRIFKHLGGICKLLYIFIIVPASILDFFYNIVAKYRYAWFGKRESCRMPDEETKNKFIE